MNLLKYLERIPKYKTVLDGILDEKNNNIYLTNSATNLSIELAALAFTRSNQNIIFVTSNTFEASTAYEKFCDLVGSESVSFYPVEEFISSELVASSITFRLARMLTLYNAINDNKRIIVTNTEGLTKQLMSLERLKKSVLNIKCGQIVERDSLINELVIRGYKKTTITEEVGTFSVRGSKVDIFPLNYESPVRIDFFDNEIESIKYFDVSNQRSINKIEECVIFPLFELFYDECQVKEITNTILKKFPDNKKSSQDIEKIKNYESLDQLYVYLPIIDPNYQPFVSIVKDPIMFYQDYEQIKEHEKASIIEVTDYLTHVEYRGTINFFITVEEARFINKKSVFLSTYTNTLRDVKLDKLYNLETLNNFEYNNNIKTLIEDIKINQEKTYIITHFDTVKLKFIEEALLQKEIKFNIVKEDNILPHEVNLVVCSNFYGFIDVENNIEILTPNEFSPGKINKKGKYQKFYKNAQKVYNKDELAPGDYVVHQEYGIGIYQGIKTVELRGTKNDYLFVTFADDGKLYIPVENIYLLEKYVADSSRNPKLNRLDGKEWSKKKAKIKEKVIEVAKKLIKVQAQRESLEGFQYSKDTVEQLQFEQDFGYNETIDQAKASEDVKKDMESKKPVDRLICGDVGFGKTEVALRAAFKAVDNGKQVAYLAPTTVLTRQHFNTFKDRFEKYGVRVELLNRFVPKAKQNQIIEGLKSGYVDIVIGTHRILSKDLVFKDLGMLIIDEEQRFGVTHKERIKEMKALVDVITLTATPIPRTLQMSLSGLKDLSLIETPPTNRLPVQTYVLESNDSVIREAINREIGRGGQVFYLLNRVQELDRLEEKVRRLVPKAKIGIIHGQLDKDEIEDQLEKFLDRIYNVLICTTIIETGIDIPNANTLIVEKADTLGLSQLYQIRGRVGRSDRISYAYLMYEPNKVLTLEASKRLEAIKEFTALGSGYKIAMRDLAIRGAGDILGDEQSGFIDAIGMDLYMQLLNEAVSEIKGETKAERTHKHFNINVSKHIDQNYVSDDEIRIEMHQSISKIKSREQIKQLIAEYTDRYGKLSKNILLYMEEKYLEFLLKSTGVENIKENGDEVILNFDEDSTKKLNFNELGKLSKVICPMFFFTYKNHSLYIEINKLDYEDSYIYTLVKFLEQIKFNK